MWFDNTSKSVCHLNCNYAVMLLSVTIRLCFGYVEMDCDNLLCTSDISKIINKNLEDCDSYIEVEDDPNNLSLHDFSSQSGKKYVSDTVD